MIKSFIIALHIVLCDKLNIQILQGAFQKGVDTIYVRFRWKVEQENFIRFAKKTYQ